MHDTNFTRTRMSYVVLVTTFLPDEGPHTVEVVGDCNNIYIIILQPNCYMCAWQDF